MTVSETRKKSNTLRIIGGQWRRRRIHFDASLDVRPTTDAARESLFNWLQPHISGSACLDLFAGSGALGFEALSRGAADVTLIDVNRHCIRILKQSAADLKADNCTILQCDARAYLRRVDRPFDVVFVDPPFNQGLAIQILLDLQKSKGLKDDGLIYLEVEREFESSDPFECWDVLRCKTAGSRAHYLLVTKPTVVQSGAMPGGGRL